MGAQLIKLLAVIGGRRYTGAYGEPGHIADPVIQRLIARRRRL
jgi:hypothetical protein